MNVTANNFYPLHSYFLSPRAVLYLLPVYFRRLHARTQTHNPAAFFWVGEVPGRGTVTVFLFSLLVLSPCSTSALLLALISEI